MAVLELVGGLALFEGVQAEVAAALSPFVGLLGQDGADQADDGVPVRGRWPTESVPVYLSGPKGRGGRELWGAGGQLHPAP